MTENPRNPKFPKLVERQTLDSLSLRIGEMQGQVEYTSSWEPVPGANGVECRTWKIAGTDADMDGGDIRMLKKGAFTGIQAINTLNVAVDTVEEGVVWSVVMDTDGQVYINRLEADSGEQMVYSSGMLICMIAETPSRFTEFESPSFNPDMFVSIPENITEHDGHSLSEFRSIISSIQSNILQSV